MTQPKSRNSLLKTAFLAISLLLINSVQVFAQNANASVDPSVSEAAVGDTFSASVVIDPNGSGITVAQIAMSYDPTIVEVNSVSISTESALFIPLPGTTIDNVEGFFFLAGYGFTPPVDPFTQLVIEFTAVGNGTSSLDFEFGGVLSTLFSANGASVTGDTPSGQIIIGEAFDCPNLSANIGDTCDDGDASTEDDTVLADCSCQGTPICTAPFPAVPEAGRSTVLGANAVSFFWTPVEGQIGCQVQVARALGAPPFEIRVFLVFGETANTFSINRNFIIPGITHGWRVKCGCSQNPLVVGPITSWNTFVLPSEIILSSSPNPTRDVSNVQFELEIESDATLEVYDMNGRLVEQLFSGYAKSNMIHRFQFDGSDLSQGIYIYRLTTNDEVINEKFVIAK